MYKRRGSEKNEHLSLFKKFYQKGAEKGVVISLCGEVRVERGLWGDEMHEC